MRYAQVFEDLPSSVNVVSCNRNTRNRSSHSINRTQLHGM